MEVAIARSFIKDLKTAPKQIQLAADKAIKKLIEASSLQACGLDYTKMEGQKKERIIIVYELATGGWA